MESHRKSNAIGRKFEADIYDLIKRNYPDDNSKLRPMKNGKETADILFTRRGVETAIEIKMRTKGSILVGPNGTIYFANQNSVPMENLKEKMLYYSRNFPFVYFISDLPVLPNPIAEFTNNGSTCFVSNYTDLYRVMNEIIRRIDIGLTPPERKLDF